MIEKEKRNIKFEYLDIPQFFINEETKEINENGLIEAICIISPQIVIMVICYSQILELKFLLEESGLFSEIRLSRDLNILSRGQILKLNNIQTKFIQKMAQEINIEKNVIITGPVGSGKTMLGLETINMKKSHYRKKYGLNSSDCKDKLRVIICINATANNMLKQQMINDWLKSTIDCHQEIHTQEFRIQKDLKPILKGTNKNYQSYSHTLVMLDEILRDEMIQVDMEECKIDYIYSIAYHDQSHAYRVFHLRNDTFECNLLKRQRSSQEILNLADFSQMHMGYGAWSHYKQKRFYMQYSSEGSFSSDKPLWIELDTPSWFPHIFQNLLETKFPTDDVMVISDQSGYDIKEFCRLKKWRWSHKFDVKGSEASVVVLFDLQSFGYEWFTRAKNQLVIVTIVNQVSDLSVFLNEIVKGKHDDNICNEYCRKYKDTWNQEIHCQFKNDKSKIQSLVRKIHFKSEVETKISKVNSVRSPPHLLKCMSKKGILQRFRK